MLLVGDVRQKIKEIDYHSVQTIVTSPPYWGLRDYDESNQIGQEKTPENATLRTHNSEFSGIHYY